MTICILGRQPKLGLAELEAVFGSQALTPLTETVVAVDAPWKAVADRPLGGVIKSAEVVDTLQASDWQKTGRRLVKLAAKTMTSSGEGKITFGISVIGFPAHSRDIEKTGLMIKRETKKSNRPVRYVQNKQPELSSATVLHNGLTRGENNYEWLTVATPEGQTIIARGRYVQDIDAYSRRDFGRPKRDAFVGMLPPKLAQIMLNLAMMDDRRWTIDDSNHRPSARVARGGAAPTFATNSSTANERKVGADRAAGPEKSEAHPPERSSGEASVVYRLLDPFCGTGVVLQEATLMGLAVYGTDLSKKMIDYSRDNLVWLEDSHGLQIDKYFEVADAQTHSWQQPIDLVVCEGYLGTPFSSQPPREKLESVVYECNQIMKNFLTNIHGQLDKGAPLVIGMPAWHIAKQFRHLPLLDYLEDLGYNRIDFEHAAQSDLIYHREDQVVGRELVVLKKA